MTFQNLISCKRPLLEQLAQNCKNSLHLLMSFSLSSFLASVYVSVCCLSVSLYLLISSTLFFLHYSQPLGNYPAPCIHAKTCCRVSDTLTEPQTVCSLLELPALYRWCHPRSPSLGQGAGGSSTHQHCGMH